MELFGSFYLWSVSIRKTSQMFSDLNKQHYNRKYRHNAIRQTKNYCQTPSELREPSPGSQGDLGFSGFPKVFLIEIEV